MFIKRLEIKRLRCVLADALDCDSMTALVGRNGAGKSCFLFALRLLYLQPQTITLEDFYNRDPSQPIELRATFGDLLPDETAAFRACLVGATVVIVKRLHWNDGKPFATTHAVARQHERFARIRAIAGKSDRKTAFNELCGTAPYETLQPVRAADDAEAQMKVWEDGHPNDCVALEREEPLVAPVAAGGALDRFTSFVYVPAVRDLTLETADNKSSALGSLLNILVTDRVEQRVELKQLREEVRERYKQIFSSQNQAELRELANEVTRRLVDYHLGSEVRLGWRQVAPPEIALPPVETFLMEDGFSGDVGRKGHGLQRAMILALLQARATVGTTAPTQRALLLAIEEPELYQHPMQCRQWMKVLRGITGTGGTQVIFTTHSPHFVDLAWFDQIRIVQKTATVGGAPWVTTTRSASLGRVAEALAAASGRTVADFTAATLRARARPVMTALVNEGFFARVVVLVEGGTEVGLLQEVARRRSAEWEAKGVAVIDAGGKANLDRPLVIFRELGIPTYVLFDGDAGSQRNSEQLKHQNRTLLQLVGAPVVDYPETGAFAHHGVMRENVETELRELLSETVYDEVLHAASTELGYATPSKAIKNVEVAALFASKAYAAGRNLALIERLVDQITRLAPG